LGEIFKDNITFTSSLFKNGKKKQTKKILEILSRLAGLVAIGISIYGFITTLK